MKRHAPALFSLLLAALLIFLLFPAGALAYYADDGAVLSYEAAAEGAVLLKNDKNALPLEKTDKIALFGVGQIVTDGKTGGFFLMGRGSGYFTLTETPKSPCDLLLSAAREGKIGGVYEPLVASYRKAAKTGEDFSYTPTAAEYSAAAAYADKAVVILSRSSAEGADNASSLFSLTAAEKTMLEKVSAAFAGKPIVAVLNIGYPIDCGFALGRLDGVYADALLSVSYPGIRGTQALCDLLTGAVSPSGKTVDTYARRLSDYPGSETFYSSASYTEYREDIYVGYRYFETFGKEIDFPFGYGLSYTSFSCSTPRCAEKNGTVTVSVTVKNVGPRAGREVVQLYFSAPQKGTGGAVLSKAAKELCAFAKTSLLEPGAEETVTLSVSVDDMASYDDLGATGHKAAYVLERGDYTFFVGSSVRDAVFAGLHRETALRVTDQKRTLCEPTSSFERMTFDGTEQIPASRSVDAQSAFVPTDAVRVERATPILFADVVGGRATMADFLSQMSDEELCGIAVMTRAYGVTAGTGAWGASAETAEKYGIPVADTADAGAGLRISTKGTGWPCATALASTWNAELAERIGEATGREAIESGVDVWLAPAVNLHRFPLCGRNFEYFSEDPFLSGTMAARIIASFQRSGAVCCVKHFAANEKEKGRNTNDSRVSERALRELYLKPFQMAVEAGVGAVMTSYNKLNGTETAENAELLRGILRGEWGFEGVVTTDWTNNSTLVREIVAGNNVKSSGSDDNLSTASLQTNVKAGRISRSLLIENATFVLSLIARLPDGRNLAERVPVAVAYDKKTLFQAENFTLKHGRARLEKSGGSVFLAYMQAEAGYLPWAEYRLTAARAGRYLLSVGLANSGTQNTKDTVFVFINGEEQNVSLNSAGTGGWYKVALREIGEVFLPAGESVLRIKTKEDSSCGNFDYFVLTPIETEDPPQTQPSVTASETQPPAPETNGSETARTPDRRSAVPYLVGGAAALAALFAAAFLSVKKRKGKNG